VKAKLGEDLAYEVMSYVALDPEYLNALLEVGYHETVAILRARSRSAFIEDEPLGPSNVIQLVRA
jgi:hypothetical protein